MLDHLKLSSCAAPSPRTACMLGASQPSHLTYEATGEEPDLLSPGTYDAAGAASSVASPMSVATTPCTPNLGASADGLAWSLPGSAPSPAARSLVSRGGTPSSVSMTDARTPSTIASGSPLTAAYSSPEGGCVRVEGGFTALEDALSRHAAPVNFFGASRLEPVSPARGVLCGMAADAGVSRPPPGASTGSGGCSTEEDASSVANSLSFHAAALHDRCAAIASISSLHSMQLVELLCTASRITAATSSGHLHCLLYSQLDLLTHRSSAMRTEVVSYG